MAGENERGALFRPIVPNQHSRVTYAELFFDLVFVFAVTQISHTLLGRFTPLGAVQTTLLFLAVWWVWVYTSWITNWLNPELTPVRLLLFLLMLGGLVLSTSIPKAFESRGLVVRHRLRRDAGRPDDVPAGCRRRRTRTLARMNAIRILVWLSVSAVFWIAGGVAEGQSAAGALGSRAGDRIYLAGGAVLDPEDTARPRSRTGSSRAAIWPSAAPASSSSRSANPSSSPARPLPIWPGPLETVTAFMSAFIGALAMWWIYFHKGAEAGSELISRSSEPGRLARLAYTYLHMPIVAGIILAAVANELVLTHPADHSDPRTVLSAIGGPLLFLVGTILFKHTIRGFLQLSHGVGIVALCVLAWFASELSPLMLSILTTAIMIVVAVWESVSLRSGAANPAESLSPKPPSA